MGKKLTHEEFLESLPINRDYTILGEYKKQADKILVNHKYGECYIQCQSLINGAEPSARNAVNKTEFFKNKLKDVNINYNTFCIEGEYVGYNVPLVVSNKYGRCLIKPSFLLNGYNLSIRSAIDPHTYFCNMVKDKNKYYREGELEIISQFKNDSEKITVRTSKGKHLIAPYSLFHNSMPNIHTALDKNEYLKNQFKEIHGDNYEYSKVEFKSYKNYVLIGCKNCNSYFYQSPDHHSRGYGCDVCANEKRGYKFSNWIKACPGEKGKFYTLRCFNENEEFIKIGITCQTISIRYGAAIHMPYEYEILSIVESEDRSEIWKIEKKLKTLLKKEDCSYTPSIHFAGAKSEVFNINNNVISKINEEISSFGGYIKFRKIDICP